MADRPDLPDSARDISPAEDDAAAHREDRDGAGLPTKAMGYGDDAERPHAGGVPQATAGAGSTTGQTKATGGPPTGTGAETTGRDDEATSSELPEGNQTPSTRHNPTGGRP